LVKQPKKYSKNTEKNFSYGEINAEAKFLVPDWRDKVDFGICLRHRPTYYIQSYAIVDFIPQTGTMILATGEYAN
jgi:hypothetical protein